MWRKNKGFVMADALVALTILSVCVGWFCLGEQQLQKQMMRSKEAVYIVRLAKEATDQYRVQHHDINEIQGAYNIRVTSHQVSVMEGKQSKLLIIKNEGNQGLP